MPKVKLSVNDLEIFKVAAENADLKFLESKELDNSNHVAIVSYKHGSQLFMAGVLYNSMKSVAKIDMQLKELSKKSVTSNTKKK